MNAAQLRSALTKLKPIYLDIGSFINQTLLVSKAFAALLENLHFDLHLAGWSGGITAWLKCSCSCLMVSLIYQLMGLFGYINPKQPTGVIEDLGMRLQNHLAYVKHTFILLTESKFKENPW